MNSSQESPQLVRFGPYNSATIINQIRKTHKE